MKFYYNQRSNRSPQKCSGCKGLSESGNLNQGETLLDRNEVSGYS
jgi:hypothetical protein